MLCNVNYIYCSDFYSSSSDSCIRLLSRSSRSNKTTTHSVVTSLHHDRVGGPRRIARSFSVEVFEIWQNRPTSLTHHVAVCIWRPLYVAIKTVARVQFVRGIPEDRYFDTRIRNPIVLDDLMSVTNKSPRIIDRSRKAATKEIYL